MDRPLQVLLAAAFFGVGGPVRAQTVLSLPGKTVEVLGLRRWTIPMIQDSMAKYAPGESLASHACAAVLRYKLGFAEASSTTYLGWIRGDTTPRVVVAVVEPEDSSRVRHRLVPMDTTAPYRPWSSAVQTAQKTPGVIEAAIGSYLRWRQDSSTRPIPPYARRDSSAIVDYWRFLANRADADDAAEARRILLSDVDYRNRVVAASILLNALGQDSTWYALVDAIREPDGIVRTMAGAVLQVGSREVKRQVDWAPAAPSVHAILDGTSLFQLPAVIDALLATGSDSRFARGFLKGGGHMLLSFVAAQHPAPRSSARRLLVALAGQDLGDDVQSWRKWVAGL